MSSRKCLRSNESQFAWRPFQRLSRFLAFTGIESQSLRDAAREPNFLLGVLDHLAADEALLHEFARQKEIAPEVVTSARDLLAGAPPAMP